MYDVSKIQTGFAGQIGWRPAIEYGSPVLSSTLTSSASGLYFNDFHPLVTFENIYACAYDYDNSYLTAWSGSVTFNKGAIVKLGTVAYISLADTNLNHNPSTSPAWWMSLNEYMLINLQGQAIIKVLQGVINNKKLAQTSKGIFENLRIFEGAGKMSNTVIKQSRFVGFEITIKKFDNLQAKIDYIGLQFSAAQTDLNIYLFHSSKKDAIATFKVSTTKADSFEWKAVSTFLLNYVNFDQTTVGNQTDAGGSFYIGYFEDDIAGQAISKDIDLSQRPCNGCPTETYNLYSWVQWTKYLNIRPVSVESSYLDGYELWDIEGNAYPRYGNFGMNLQITVKAEITDFILRNKSVFLDAWGKQVAVDVLNIIRTSIRNNAISESTKQAALFDLKGDSAKENTGLEYELQQAIKAIEIDISGIDSPMLDKYKKSPLKFKAI